MVILLIILGVAILVWFGIWTCPDPNKTFRRKCPHCGQEKEYRCHPR